MRDDGNHGKNPLIIRLYADIEPIPKARMTYRSKWSGEAKKSLVYQESLAWLIRQQNPGIKQTNKPLSLTVTFGRTDRRRCDLKNLIAALEDALQFSGLIKDDCQITEYRRCKLELGVTPPFIKMEIKEST